MTQTKVVIAALPPHTAVRLCLTVAPLHRRERLRLPASRQSLDTEIKKHSRKGGAFPQCAAAEPQVFGQATSSSCRRLLAYGH